MDLYIPEECPICLVEFELNQQVLFLKHCLHVYHLECIREWAQWKMDCPCCRGEMAHLGVRIVRLRDPDDEAAAGVVDDMVDVPICPWCDRGFVGHALGYELTPCHHLYHHYCIHDFLQDCQDGDDDRCASDACGYMMFQVGDVVPCYMEPAPALPESFPDRVLGWVGSHWVLVVSAAFLLLIAYVMG